MNAMLVGRAGELALLDAALDEALGGRGGMLLVSGEPGVGKSALAEHVAARAAATGAVVAWGRAWEAGGAPAFWPWIEVLRSLVDAHDDATLRKLLAHGAADIAQLVPEIAHRLELPAISPTAPGAERFRLFDVVAGFLVRGSEPVPAVVILEDLHVADASSLLLLAFVAPRLTRGKLLVLGTFREVEARLDPEIDALLQKVSRHARSIALDRLDLDAVRELVAAARLPTTDDLAERVLAATEGNALFVTEVLRMLRARGGPATAYGSIPIPTGVRGAIRDRLAPVASDTRALLEIGAVVGREMDLRLVATVASAPIETVRSAMLDASRHGIVTELTADRWRFAHVLVRDVIYEDSGARHRAELHLELASTLERLHADDPDSPLAEIARHLANAGVGFSLRAVDTWMLASRRASEKLAFEEAVTLLERALALLTGVAPGDSVQQCELLLELGTMQLRAGLTERGAVSCLEAARVARRLGSSELLARAGLAFGGRLMLAVRHRELIAMLEEALEKLPVGDGALRARVMARLAAAQMPSDQPHAVVEMARAAVEMARRLDDRATLLAVLNGAGSAFADFAPADERARIDGELVALATELGDKPLVLRGRARLIIDELQLGNLAAVDEHVRAYDHLASEFRTPHVQWPTYLFRTIRPLLEGRFDEARALAETGRAVAARAGDRNAETTFLFHEWWRARVEGLTSDLARLNARTQAQFAKLGMLGSGFLGGFMACIAAQEGDLDAARMHAERALASPDVLTEAAILTTLAEGVAAVGDPALAQRALDVTRAYQHPEQMSVLGLAGIACDGPLGRPFMLLAITAGQWEQAESYFAGARAMATHVRAAPALARIELEWGEALARRGRPGDVAAAVSLVASAKERATALGMVDFARRAQTLLERLASNPGLHAAPITRATSPDDELSARIHDAKLSSLGDLVAGIAHEINNPLGALQSTADVARRAVEMLSRAMQDPEMVAAVQKNPSLARALDVLQKTQTVTPEATGRIARVVSELRSFARLDQAEVDRVDLRDSLDSTVAMLGRDLDGRIELVREYEELPRVRCRPREIHSAFLHVLRNAAQSIDGTGTITLSLAREGELAVVAVADTGCGIPAQNLSRIFDPGFTTRGSGVGVGLGLAIVHRVLREHGGSIDVASEPERGSVLTMRIPIEAAPS